MKGKKMNRIERALMDALFVHLHHNIDRAVDFGAIEALNREVGKIWPGGLVIGPGDDAAVIRMPGVKELFVAKMESHCSPCVPRPYGSAATGASGAIRDIVAMGAIPVFLLDFVGTRPIKEKVIVGPCGFKRKCTCGNCKEMTSKERLDLIMKGVRDMCAAMNVFIIGGGLSTSFSDIVPAVVVAVIGKLIIEKPLTKPAKSVGDKIILVGQTSSDGNDSLFRAGLVKEMQPAIALFEEEKQTMDATLSAIRTNEIKACSDLGAAGIGAAVCESARYGGFGAKIDLSSVPVKVNDLTSEEILICETQARMILQVEPKDVEEVITAIQSKGAKTAMIGEITDDNKEIFEYKGETVAVIPNEPSEVVLKELKKEA